MKLLSVNSDAKTSKGTKEGVLTGVQYFAPSNLSGFNVCKGATDGCRLACLGWYAGRVSFTPNIKDARVRKTRFFFEEPDAYFAQLEKEIRALVRKAAREGLEPAVRLNGSSDIPWERVQGGRILRAFPDVQFYDYSKLPNRDVSAFPNYDLTFSLAESNEAAAKEALANGMRVAVVFRSELPGMFWGAPVIDGDQTDIRFRDPSGVIVGLRAKGAAKKDVTGFVREAA